MAIRAAVVGTGFIGPVHVEALQRIGVEVIGLCGSRPERAETKARRLGIPRVYQTYEELLADPSVDVVHIATPNAYHYPQARAALLAGKHVVCEKPLAMNARESAELVEIAERSGLIHAVCYNIRFYPMVQHARAINARIADPTAPIVYPTFADGHEMMQVLEAIITSAREGRWVEFPRGS